MLTNTKKDFFFCCCHVNFLLAFPPSKNTVILSRFVCHHFPLLPRPLNSLNNTCLSDALRTKTWAFHLEGNLKFQQTFFSPLSSVSECSLLYPTLWNSKLLLDKNIVTLLLPCALICSYQVMPLSNNNFFSQNISIGWVNSKRQVSLVHLIIPQLVHH